jgi:hypothetical protein
MSAVLKRIDGLVVEWSGVTSGSDSYFASERLMYKLVWVGVYGAAVEE